MTEEDIQLHQAWLGLNPYLLIEFQLRGEDLFVDIDSGGGIPTAEIGVALAAVVGFLPPEQRAEFDKALAEIPESDDD